MALAHDEHCSIPDARSVTIACVPSDRALATSMHIHTLSTHQHECILELALTSSLHGTNSYLHCMYIYNVCSLYLGSVVWGVGLQLGYLTCPVYARCVREGSRWVILVMCHLPVGGMLPVIARVHRKVGDIALLLFGCFTVVFSSMAWHHWSEIPPPRAREEKRGQGLRSCEPYCALRSATRYDCDIYPAAQWRVARRPYPQSTHQDTKTPRPIWGIAMTGSNG